MAKFKLERKLYSKDQYINEMIEKAFCDGYLFAQRMYAEELTPEQISKNWLHKERTQKEMEAAFGGPDTTVSTRAEVVGNQPQVETKPKTPRKGTKAALEAEKAELQKQLDAANKSHESKLGDMRKNSETQANKIKELEKQLKEQTEKSKGLSGKEKNKILQQGRQKGRRQVGLIGGMQNQWRRSSTLGKAGMVGAGVAGAGALIGAGSLIGRSSRRED